MVETSQFSYMWACEGEDQSVEMKSRLSKGVQVY